MGATSMGVHECCGAVLQPGPPLFPVTLVARKLRHRSIYEQVYEGHPIREKGYWTH